MDVDNLGERREPFAMHLQTVEAEREAPGCGLAVRSTLVGSFELIDFAREVDRCGEREPGGVGYSDAQFTCFSLGQERQRAKE